MEKEQATGLLISFLLMRF